MGLEPSVYTAPGLQLREYFPDGRLDQQIRMGIPGGGCLVDYDQLIAAEIVDESCRRIYGKGRAADDQHLSIADETDSIVHCSGIKSFPVQHYVRFHGTAAFFTLRYVGAVRNIVHIIKGAAFSQ